MEVKIYWSATGIGRGMVEKLATPHTLDWADERAGWHESQRLPGSWCLMVRQGTPDEFDDEKESWSTRELAVADCETENEYLEWLCKNVDLVEIDGRVYWQNPGPDGSEEDEGDFDDLNF